MKNIAVAVSCLLCGVLLGVVLSASLFFGGFTFPGIQSAQDDRQASSSASVTPAQKTESIPAQNPADASITELSKPGEQTALPADMTLSEFLRADNPRAINPQSSIAELQQVLSLIASANLDELNNAVANLPTDNNRMHEYHWVFGLITQRRIELDPAGTMQEINQLVSQQGGVPYDDMASYLLIENFARLQPEALIDWLGGLSDNTIRPEQLMSIYSALAESAPESAMELLMQNNTLASNHFGGPEMILYTWSDKDPLAALQWLEHNGDQLLLDQHVESIISLLASRDPEAARLAAARFPELVSEDVFAIQEIRILAESDPLAAIEMAQSLSNSDELDNAMHTILYAWSAKDPIAAFAHIESIADVTKRQMYAYSMVDSLASQASLSPAKRQELLSWSESLSPELQIAVREPILSEWASYDPEAAIEWLNTKSGWSENPRLVAAIAWNLPNHNIDLAMEVYANADQETQMILSQGIVSELYQQNPQAAWNWYEALPENDAKQSSLFSLVMITAQENPQEALDLASNINAGNNPDMVTEVIQALAFEFPDDVESWLHTANIDEQRKSELRTMVTQMRQEMIGLPMHELGTQYLHTGPTVPAYDPFYRMQR